MTFPHPFEPVRQVDRASISDIRAALDNDEPLLLPGAIASSPFFKRLHDVADDAAKLAFLAQTFGNREVGVVVLGESGRVPGEEKRVRKLPFSELASAMRSQLAAADP
jgi:hypothetical protein